VDALSGEFDLASYRDTYVERLQELINKKLAGDVVVVEEAEKEEVKSLMEALRKTVEELKAKQE
jgi:non-homologous end joining protein Ku